MPSRAPNSGGSAVSPLSGRPAAALLGGTGLRPGRGARSGRIPPAGRRAPSYERGCGAVRCRSPPLSETLSPCVSLSLCLSVSLSLTLSHTRSLFLSLAFSLCLSLSVILSLFYPTSYFIFSPSLSLCLSPYFLTSLRLLPSLATCFIPPSSRPFIPPSPLHLSLLPPSHPFPPTLLSLHSIISPSLTSPFPSPLLYLIHNGLESSLAPISPPLCVPACPHHPTLVEAAASAASSDFGFLRLWLLPVRRCFCRL